MQIRRGSDIKSIQRGVINSPLASFSQTVNAVNTAKSKLNFLGNNYGGTDVTGAMVYMTLFSSTQINFVRVGSASTINVSWELIEYY